MKRDSHEYVIAVMTLYGLRMSLGGRPLLDFSRERGKQNEPAARLRRAQNGKLQRAVIDRPYSWIALNSTRSGVLNLDVWQFTPLRN